MSVFEKLGKFIVVVCGMVFGITWLVIPALKFQYSLLPIIVGASALLNSLG
jgi:hypothetical protein